MKETLDSVFAQTKLPDEILIGDDSPDDETELLVTRELIPSAPVPIVYHHHRPSLREVRNVDFLYANAKGDAILHLHDDDPIYPNCVADLSAALIAHPAAAAAFGRQRQIDDAGAYQGDDDAMNAFFFRTSDRAGLVDGFQAAAIRMFPNNGFLVRTAIARATGYSDQGRAGLATDFDFGLRLGKQGHPFVFVDSVTCKVRMTTVSQSRGKSRDNAYRALKLLLAELRGRPADPVVSAAITRRIPISITEAFKLGDTATGWSWLLSPYYRSRLLSPGGIKLILYGLALSGRRMFQRPRPGRA